MIIFHPDENENCLRIYEHGVGEDNIINMQRKKKFDLPDMSTKSSFSTCHTAMMTENEELLILVDKVDMHIFDLRESKP